MWIFHRSINWLCCYASNQTIYIFFWLDNSTNWKPISICSEIPQNLRLVCFFPGALREVRVHFREQQIMCFWPRSSGFCSNARFNDLKFQVSRSEVTLKLNKPKFTSFTGRSLEFGWEIHLEKNSRHSTTKNQNSENRKGKTWFYVTFARSGWIMCLQIVLTDFSFCVNYVLTDFSYLLLSAEIIEHAFLVCR